MQLSANEKVSTSVAHFTLDPVTNSYYMYMYNEVF